MIKAVYVQSICPICNSSFSFYKRKPKTYCTFRCFKSLGISREAREKISNAMKGKIPKNIELIQKKSAESRKGKPLPLEQRIKISISNTGKTVSEKTKKKISLKNSGNGNGMYGKGDRQKGNKNTQWRGGLSTNKEHLRNQKRLWRESNREKHRFNNKQYEYRLKTSEGRHTLEQWGSLKKKFNYMCLCCKRFEPEIKLTEDHIIPLSRGGNNDITNIQPLCISCNTRKHTKSTNFIILSTQKHEQRT